MRPTLGSRTSHWSRFPRQALLPSAYGYASLCPADSEGQNAIQKVWIFEPVNTSFDLGSGVAQVRGVLAIGVLRAVRIVSRTISAGRNAELFENRSCPFCHDGLPAIESVRMIPLRLGLDNKSLIKIKRKVNQKRAIFGRARCSK